MIYVDRLMQDEQYQRLCQRLVEMEQERSFCNHDYNHFLNVARIGAIINQENHFQVDLEMIYLCALLHDIGRAKQDRDQISHSQASQVLAGEILLHIGYPVDKRTIVVEAIGRHGKRGAQDELLTREYIARKICDSAWVTDTLAYLLQTADQLSRNCFACPVIEQCKWNEAEKIKSIVR